MIGRGGRDLGGLPGTLAGLAGELREGAVSPVEATEAALGLIEERDGELNSFITVTPERAMEVARRAEREIRAGRYRGPLHGVPLGLKDLIPTAGVRTTMGSAFFEGHVPGYDAAVVEKLEEAGAVLVGKNNTHEFAYGTTGDRSRFGPVRNPHDTSRISGGSSSGSGAAVAVGLVYGALGTDTGGSIRIPAALCGVVGMKPTFGRVSKRGVFPLAWTLDHVGPLTRTVRDNALLLSALAGHDPEDPYSVRRAPEDFARDLGRGVRGGVVGVPSGFYFDGLDGEVAERVAEAIGALRGLGVRTRPVAVPLLRETLDAQRLVLAAEAYAVHAQRLRSEPERFDEEVRERVAAGEALLAHEYAVAQRTKLASLRVFDRALEGVDVLLAPTVPLPATEIGQREVRIAGREEPVRASLNRFTGPTNLNGLPSLSVPCGRTASGLPVGLQMVGRPFDEATLYRYAHALEQAAGV
ncbi:Asp-tRNA(Asn)/Glu-tRNA(Gln) amidotransferase subunit GatA [Rubrobacter marinus]|uniref:Asp-tRNA(Asn)/Glu-tRNA(Gln) amidotransferase subunit GatA n=1 Tax=Rubrobacter marinus TaxID=2653852 RepID=A0A6G8PU09_9ACTN|nr:amidase [Rubrobacter marinus]QIN77824.1 Asp-tRNA(Asn)/Glu-tRNA(Gln) amidotransferase subunit GatA [Rubrobacter marinus]